MSNLERRARLLLSDVVRPTLRFLARNEPRLDREAAAQLLVGTAVVESGLKYPLQLGMGPARSYFQIELATAEDINERYGERFELFKLLVPTRMISYEAEFLMQLAWNQYLACAVARLKYWSAPAPLPADGDIAALGAYWKRWYNTPLGAGTAEQFIRKAGPVIRAIWPNPVAPLEGAVAYTGVQGRTSVPSKKRS